MSKPLKVDQKALVQIQDFAHKAFLRRQHDGGMGSDFRVVVLLEGLYSWMKLHGVEPGFELKQEVSPDDFESLEDLQ